MTFAITSLYVGFGALIFVALAFRVSLQRMKHQVGLGDGGSPEVLQAVRAHGNCAEYLPLLLLIVAATEASGAPAWVVHAFGAATIAGRILHAAGLSASSGRTLGRMLGTMLSWGVLVFGGIGAIGHALL